MRMSFSVRPFVPSYRCCTFSTLYLCMWAFGLFLLPFITFMHENWVVGVFRITMFGTCFFLFQSGKNVMKNYLKVNYGQPNVIKKNNKKLYVLLVPFLRVMKKILIN